VIKIDPHIQLFVRDQDEALAFYTEKLGMQVRRDATNDAFRWLTVGPEGQPDVNILLAAIPARDAETAEEARRLMEAGVAGTLFLTTDDCQASYEELAGRGVQFDQAPEENPWATVARFRDPSGNHIQLTQSR